MTEKGHAGGDDRRRDGGARAERPGRRACCSAIPAARCCRSTTRCSTRKGCATSWCATSRAPRTRPRAMRARPAGRACLLVTSGPGATNAVTGLTDALMDSIPHRVHHRPGADPSDRLGRLPGMRHGRHHAPLHQAQLSREATSPTCRASCTRRSTSPRTGRPGPVVVDIPKDVQFATRPLCPPARQPAQDLPAPRQGRPGKIKAAVALMARRQAAGLLHRRRRHQFRARTPPAAARVRPRSPASRSPRP